MAVIILRKLFEDGENIYISGITIPSGQKLPFRDKTGFPMIEFDENGNIIIKGSVKKALRT